MNVMTKMALCKKSEIKTDLVGGQQNIDAQIILRIAAPIGQIFIWSPPQRIF
jgi:hypothetical protein